MCILWTYFLHYMDLFLHCYGLVSRWTSFWHYCDLDLSITMVLSLHYCRLLAPPWACFLPYCGLVSCHYHGPVLVPLGMCILWACFVHFMDLVLYYYGLVSCTTINLFLYSCGLVSYTTMKLSCTKVDLHDCGLCHTTVTFLELLCTYLLHYNGLVSYTTSAMFFFLNCVLHMFFFLPST